jgi:hypothetical protein
MSDEFRELDAAQLANVTGGGPILQWLASRPLRRWIMRRRGAAGGEGAASSGGGEAAQPSGGGEGGGE